MGSPASGGDFHSEAGYCLLETDEERDNSSSMTARDALMTFSLLRLDRWMDRYRHTHTHSKINLLQTLETVLRPNSK